MVAIKSLRNAQNKPSDKVFSIPAEEILAKI